MVGLWNECLLVQMLRPRLKTMKDNSHFDRTILLLQGGGALGAYHVGVYKGLVEYGYSPNWIISTSIGAINSAIIAGNPPEKRVKQLEDFWQTISLQIPSFPETLNNIFLKKCHNFYSAAFASTYGLPHFFIPREVNPWLSFDSSPDKLSYYTTDELRRSLMQFIDFDLINEKKIRLSMGSVHVATGNLVYFDNSKMTITPDHVMASCALPPAFPAVCIQDQMFWDGGIHSNTQINLLFSSYSPDRLLCFMVQVFNSYGCRPKTMDEIYKRTKDISYASHHRDFIVAYRNEYNLRNAIYTLGKYISQKDRDIDPHIQSLIDLGHPGILHLARFHYAGRDEDLSTKDFNFAQNTISDHIQAGCEDTTRLLKDPPWKKKPITQKGLYLYEVSDVLFEDDKPIE